MLRPGLDPVIIDVEASGFDPLSYPIEVGIALRDQQRFSMLVKPLPKWTHWDKTAEKVHQIDRELLERYGKPVDCVAKKLNELLHGMTIYSDGWVVDKPWMEMLFYEARMGMQFQLSPIELILSEEQMAIWHATKNEVIRVANPQRHRASSDAWIIQQTWLQSAEAVKEVAQQ